MRCKALLLWGALVVLVGGVQAEEIGYIEDFALAQDRTEALKQLIPGTEDFYYYHCLHYQNIEQYDRVEQLLQAWIQRYNYTPRVREIQYRQALLTYLAAPEGIARLPAAHAEPAVQSSAAVARRPARPAHAVGPRAARPQSADAGCAAELPESRRL